METNKNKETKTNIPPIFTVIGKGNVFDKYWRRAVDSHIVQVSHVISLEDPKTTLKQGIDKYQYHQTDGSDERTIEILKGIVSEEGLTNIALLTPAVGRTDFIEKFLKEETLSGSVLFVEKPFGRTHEEIESMRWLVNGYPGRLHLSEKYTIGRADFFLEIVGQRASIPERIKATMIEGGDYYKKVKDKEDHPYRKDGPEMDLGVHILGIVAALTEKLDGFNDFSVVLATDPALNPRQWLPGERYDKGFVSVAQLILNLKGGRSIPVDLTIGKAEGDTIRNITLFYPGGESIRQEYSTGTPYDTVTTRDSSGITEIAQRNRSKFHQYYSSELVEGYGEQSPEEQERILDVNDTCIKIKEIREGRHR